MTQEQIQTILEVFYPTENEESGLSSQKKPPLKKQGSKKQNYDSVRKFDESIEKKSKLLSRLDEDQLSVSYTVATSPMDLQTKRETLSMFFKVFHSLQKASKSRKNHDGEGLEILGDPNISPRTDSTDSLSSPHEEVSEKLKVPLLSPANDDKSEDFTILYSPLQLYSSDEDDSEELVPLLSEVNDEKSIPDPPIGVYSSDEDDSEELAPLLSQVNDEKYTSDSSIGVYRSDEDDLEEEENVPLESTPLPVPEVKFSELQNFSIRMPDKKVSSSSRSSNDENKEEEGITPSSENKENSEASSDAMTKKEQSKRFGNLNLFGRKKKAPLGNSSVPNVEENSSHSIDNTSPKEAPNDVDFDDEFPWDELIDDKEFVKDQHVIERKMKSSPHSSKQATPKVNIPIPEVDYSRLENYTYTIPLKTGEEARIDTNKEPIPHPDDEEDIVSPLLPQNSLGTEGEEDQIRDGANTAVTAQVIGLLRRTWNKIVQIGQFIGNFFRRNRNQPAVPDEAAKVPLMEQDKRNIYLQRITEFKKEEHQKGNYSYLERQRKYEEDEQQLEKYKEKEQQQQSIYGRSKVEGVEESKEIEKPLTIYKPDGIEENSMPSNFMDSPVFKIDEEKKEERWITPIDDNKQQGPDDGGELFTHVAPVLTVHGPSYFLPQEKGGNLQNKFNRPVNFEHVNSTEEKVSDINGTIESNDSIHDRLPQEEPSNEDFSFSQEYIPNIEEDSVDSLKLAGETTEYLGLGHQSDKEASSHELDNQKSDDVFLNRLEVEFTTAVDTSLVELDKMKSGTLGETKNVDTSSSSDTNSSLDSDLNGLGSTSSQFEQATAAARKQKNNRKRRNNNRRRRKNGQSPI